jgi:hemoglobin
MDIKRDIESRADIEIFIRAFYEKVTVDSVIGKIFTEIFPLNWAHHIPLITDFWETILLDHPVYKKNAMQVHYEMNNVFPFKKEHFDAWLHLFNTTLDEMYSGEKVLLAKKRAAGIAQLMQLKMDTGNSSIPLR